VQAKATRCQSDTMMIEMGTDTCRCAAASSHSDRNSPTISLVIAVGAYKNVREDGVAKRSRTAQVRDWH